VLDGGPGEVFLQGTRLSRFMESVERVTTGIGPADAPPEAESAEAVMRPEPAAQEHAAVPGVAEAPPPAADPWAPLVDAGLALVSELARRNGDGAALPAGWIERDASTGRECLKLPLPEPATLERVAQALSALAAALRR
jgi:hypothetical protein